MKIKTRNIKSYNFTDIDYLLDTNIWLFIYGPQQQGDQKAAIYSDALDKMIKAKSHLYIDVLIVSEFINTYSRLKSKLLGRSDFKNFRKSKDFKPIASEISCNLKRILNICSPIDNGIEPSKLKQLVEEYAQGYSDFNDQILTELCKRRNLTLVTHDADFKGQEISIVTANKQLLEPIVA